VVRRQLTLGARGGAEGYVEVRDGLQAGTQLLAVKMDRLEPGTPVRVVGGAGAPAAPGNIATTAPPDGGD